MKVEFNLIDSENLSVILPLLAELDASIPFDVLESRLTQMITAGYECVGIYHNENLIGICGVWTLVKYYVGKHLEPDNVYIRPEFRSKGIGKELNSWLKSLAISRGCEAIELNCYIKNQKGQDFWLANEYQAIGIHYQKKLTDF